MPALTVLFVRSALLALLTGALLGAALLGLPAWQLPVRALHAELLLVGWLLQLALGVAYWILPKHARPPVRGPTMPIIAAWVFLNGGVLLTGLGLTLGAEPWIVALGRALELAAISLMILGFWSRIRPYGRQTGVGREVAGPHNNVI